jgi:sulfide:quinone oxidoreductase
MAQQGGEAGLEVLIAGAGVAGLEAAFALRELAGERARVTLMAPGSEFVYRPMAVGEPFSASWARHYPLAELAARAGAEFVQDALASVDPQRRLARTSSGAERAYDALLVCVGTKMHAAFEHVTTVDDRRIDELLHGLVQDLEGGNVKSLAVIVPAPPPWPLPAYELALMCAERAWDMQSDTKITLVTPEERPLGLFGANASTELARLLSERRVGVITSAYCEVPEPRTIVIHPGDRSLHADRIVALPALDGPGIDGLPQDGGGFIPVDEYGRVRDVDGVWAAGDGTDFPIKHGGVSAQLADTAAASIAALTGASGPPPPFDPAIDGVLLTGDTPRHLETVRLRGQQSESGLSEIARGAGTPKIGARYLQPELAALDAE